MKALVLLMAIAITVSLPKHIFAQSYASNLRQYCSIDTYAEYLLKNSGTSHSVNLEMTDYSHDVDGITFQTEMAALYQWGHCYVPLDKAANDLWLLVSKQLTGSPGQLSLTRANFIPTKNEKGQEVLAIVMWNENISQWTIMSMPVSRVKTLNGGAKMFSLRS
jgi:hypothetical protein